jgi:hypothetical protein
LLQYSQITGSQKKCDHNTICLLIIKRESFLNCSFKEKYLKKLFPTILMRSKGYTPN